MQRSIPGNAAALFSEPGGACCCGPHVLASLGFRVQGSGLRDREWNMKRAPLFFWEVYWEYYRDPCPPKPYTLNPKPTTSKLLGMQRSPFLLSLPGAQGGVR